MHRQKGCTEPFHLLFPFTLNAYNLISKLSRERFKLDTRELSLELGIGVYSLE